MSIEPDKTNPFAVLKSQSPDAIQAEMDRRWEHARVRYTLTRLGLAKYNSQMSRKVSDRPEEAYLTFELFDEFFPSFPMILSTDRLSTVEVQKTGSKELDETAKVDAPPLHQNLKAVHPRWFKSFLALPFIPPYEEIFNKRGSGTKLRPVGLVFPRKGFPQGLVVHNGDVYDFVSQKSGCHYYLGGGKKPMNLVVQSYQSLLDQIRRVKHWKPEDVSF